MSSTFTITFQHVLLELTNLPSPHVLGTQNKIAPFFKIDIPGIRNFVSNVVDEEKHSSSGSFIYEFQDTLEMDYKCTDPAKLALLYMSIEIFSDFTHKRIKTDFIGDFQIDLYSLFVGPVMKKMEVLHSDYRGFLYFECRVDQRTKASLILRDLSVKNMKFKCSIYGVTSEIDINSNGDTVLQLKRLKYNDLKNLTLNIKADKIKDIIIPLSTIYLYMEQGDYYRTKFTIDQRQIDFQIFLLLENAPRYVQSIQGTHFTLNSIPKFYNFSYPNGTMSIDAKPDNLFSQCDLPCEPPYNPHMTLHPIEMKIEFDKIEFQLHLEKDPKRYKFLYLTISTPSSTTSSIPFRINARNKFVLSQAHPPYIIYSTRAPYKMTKEYVHFVFSSKPDTIELINEVLIPINRLLSDPNEIVVDLIGVIDGTINIIARSETLSKTIYITFKNLLVRSLNKQGKYAIGIKVDNESDIIKDKIELIPEDNRSGSGPSYLLKCLETKSYPLTYSSVSYQNKKIVIRILKLMKNPNKPVITLAKYELFLRELYPFQPNIEFELKSDESRYSVDGRATIYTNTDHLGFYLDFHQINELTDTNDVNQFVRRFQPSFIPFSHNIEITMSNNDDSQGVRFFSSSHEVNYRDLVLEKNDDLREILFRKDDNVVFSLDYDTLRSISSIAYLFVMNRTHKFLVYTPFAHIYNDALQTLSSNLSPFTSTDQNECEVIQEYKVFSRKNTTNKPVTINNKKVDTYSTYCKEEKIASLSSGADEDNDKQRYYIPCVCERLFELTCLSCNQPLLNLSYWTVVKYTCRNMIENKIYDPPTRKPCGTGVFYIKQGITDVKNRNFDLNLLQCQVCGDKCRQIDDSVVSKIVFRCSCSAMYDSYCSGCGSLLEKLTPYYKKTCKKCNQVLLVTQNGRNCPYCRNIL